MSLTILQVQARRRELHLAAAQTLELLYSTDLAPFYGQIAYHYEQAFHQGLFAVREQALTYLRQAGEQAAANYENETAVDYFSRALALLEENDPTTRFELLLVREKACHNGGLLEQQRADLQALSSPRRAARPRRSTPERRASTSASRRAASCAPIAGTARTSSTSASSSRPERPSPTGRSEEDDTGRAT